MKVAKQADAQSIPTANSKSRSRRRRIGAIDKTPSFIPLWIPANLNLPKVVENIPPNFSGFKTEIAYFFIDYLIELQSTRHNLVDEHTGYTRMASKILEKHDKLYSKYFRWFEDVGIIECHRYYKVGEQCYGYRFTNTYFETPIVRIYLSLSKRFRTLIKNKPTLKKRGSLTVGRTPGKYPFLQYHANQLTIDKEATAFRHATLENAIKNPETLPLKVVIEQLENGECQFRHRRLDCFARDRTAAYCISRIENQQMAIIFDEKGGRAYSPFTWMPKIYRNFLLYHEKRLVEIDIPSSQPSFLLALLQKGFWIGTIEQPGVNYKKIENEYLKDLMQQLQSKKRGEGNSGGGNSGGGNNGPLMFSEIINMIVEQIELEGFSEEVLRYKNLVASRQLYEAYGSQFPERPSGKNLRALAKDYFVKMLFSKNEQYSNLKTVFEKMFPRIGAFIKFLKGADHRLLAILLQAAERFIVLDTICVDIVLERPKTPLLPCHDAIFTTEGNEAYVAGKMANELTKIFGFRPVFEPTFLRPDNLRIDQNVESPFDLPAMNGDSILEIDLQYSSN